MVYKLWCGQRGQPFADNPSFNTLEEVKEQLMSYHEIDMEEEDLEILKKMSLGEILTTMEWEVHDEKGKIIKVK